MRIKTLLQSAAVIALALVAGLCGVGGTWALWNTAAPANSGTVQSADFRVEINGTPMIVNGVAATVALEDPGTALTPTAPAYSVVTVKNATNASAPFSVSVAAGQPHVTSPNAALPASVTVWSSLMPESQRCADAAYASAPATTTITQGTTAQICLRMTLPENAPETLSHATATVTVPITATQTQ
ncbi:hypothetical protein [Citricoccus alkalitolerans]|uniref:Ribosomally synthesized peptide with SipW-like signal peptide n=1 Tax=Citricoccus alkalitolerans TaxID=246603 RepID=A0ABV8XS59_9MICC